MNSEAFTILIQPEKKISEDLFLKKEFLKCSFKKILFIYLFIERREGREKERKRNIDVGEKH